jgi:hypothetical protein
MRSGAHIGWASDEAEEIKMIEFLKNGYAVERGVRDPNGFPEDPPCDRLFQTSENGLEFYVYAGLPLEAFYTISMLWHIGFNAGEKHGREQQLKEIRKALGLTGDFLGRVSFT